MIGSLIKTQNHYDITSYTNYTPNIKHKTLEKDGLNHKPQYPNPTIKYQKTWY